MKKPTWTIVLISERDTSPGRQGSVSTLILVFAIFTLLIPIGGIARGIFAIQSRIVQAIVGRTEKKRSSRLVRESLALEIYLDNVMSAILTDDSSSSKWLLSQIPDKDSDHLTARAGFSMLPDLFDPLHEAMYRLSWNAHLAPHFEWKRTLPFRAGELIEPPPPELPVACPVNGIITSRFGMRTDPVYEGTAIHLGIDIAGKLWTPIVATANGVVTFAGRKSRWGNVVFIKHGEDYLTIYAHLRRVAVAESTIVIRGQLIGYLGNTGKSTGPHLHYEVRRNGIALDPLAFILPYEVIAD